MPTSDPDDSHNDWHDHPIRICYRDTDQMGMVYYGNYFTFMEIGRVELLRARGWSYHGMEADGIRIPVIHASCDYRNPALYDDLIRIRTFLTRSTRVRLEFAYEIYCDERSQLLATGETKHVFLDMDNAVTRIGRDVLRRIAGQD